LGVVVVTLNYRLGALGFYGANFGSGGNIPFSLGIRDQQNAINWVIANIGIFGGDSSKITLFGESAGAMSVGLHTFAVPSNLQTSGQNKVLPWRAAIMESNPFASVYPAPTDPRETGVANAFLASICSQTTGGGKSCSNAQVAQAGSLSFLQNAATITPEVILTAQSAATLAPDAFIATGAINLPWTPVLDNTFITSQPLAGFQPNVTPIPVGFGVNQNEGAVFAGMALKKLGAAGVATAYQAEIDRLFGAKGVLAVEKIPRYNPALQPTPPSYATGASLALGNLITDYGMWCGNVYAMNNVVGQQGPVFGYLFSETPFTDLYNLKGTSVGTGGDNGACEPTASPTNVCHANELPYVFNNLGAVTRGAPLNYSPTQNDTQIAPLMNTAWVAFALNPSSPGPNWTPYQTATNSGGGLVGQWVQGQMAGNMTLNTGVGVWKGTPMCSGFWFTEPPYNGSSTSMGGKSAH
jgi:para-nitrobenzyl esterase